MKKSEKNTNKQISLTVSPRTVLGKQVRKLRKEGSLPGNVYGADFPSTPITVKYSDFAHIYKIVHETGVVYLQLDKKEIPTLVKHIQRHPIDSTVLHVDFRKVDLTKKVIAEVPVKVIGISEAVAQKGGVLLTQSTHLSVEALPQDIPNVIEIDVSVLKELGQDIKVSQLPKTATYTVMNDSEKVIVSVTAHKEESIIAETTAAAAPEVLTAKAPVEGEAGTEAVATPGEKKETKKETSTPTAEKKEPAKK